MKLILASASIGRKHLLNLLKIPYEIMPTEIDEEKVFGTTPFETIRLRAKLKADKIMQLHDFVIKVEGSLSNIIGLPLEKVIPLLEENHILT